MNLDQKTIEAMKAAGISFVGSVPAPWGGITETLEPEDLAPFIQDRKEWFASRNGAFKQQYLDWVATSGEPRCGAKTSKGTLCKNTISGGIQRPFEVWLQEDGGFCHVHGGATSKEARKR